MPITTRILLRSTICLLTSLAICQQPTAHKIQLTAPTIQRTATFAVWRTDFYICTGIAYAKSLGQTVDDFANFVGNHHDWENMRGKGLEPAAKTLNFLIKLYENGRFEVLAQSDSLVSMRSNRPYAPYFKEGPIFGVSIDEFERCLWGHIAILAARIGLDFKYRIQGEDINSTLSFRK
jgi:hypothetical protein